MYCHGSQTVHCDAVLHHFKFPRASHKSKFSAVLFIELITIKFQCSDINLPKNSYCSSAIVLTVDSLIPISWLWNCHYCLLINALHNC